MVRWPNPKNLSLPRIKAARLAAARARHNPTDKKRTAWEVAELYWTRFTTLFRNGVALLVACFGLYILWLSVTQKVISIAPIAVPKILADGGYTSDVAVERLQSALKGILYRVHSLKREPSISTQAGTSSIVVPSTGVSVESLAAYIRTFLPFDRHRSVSGEITVAQNKLWLRLRIEGRDCHVSANGSDLERPDDLFMDGAQRIMEELAPYHLAVYLKRSDLSKSIKIAKRIIANPKEWVLRCLGRIPYSEIFSATSTMPRMPLSSLIKQSPRLSTKGLGSSGISIAVQRLPTTTI